MLFWGTRMRGWVSGGSVSVGRLLCVPVFLWLLFDQHKRAEAAFLLGAGMYSSFIVIPQFAQLPRSTGFGFGASIVVSGLYLLPCALGMGLLGTAAGGGFPQWNCWCPTCRVARVFQKQPQPDHAGRSDDPYPPMVVRSVSGIHSP